MHYVQSKILYSRGIRRMENEITEEEIRGVLLEVIGIVNEARLGNDREANIENALFHLKVIQNEIDYINIANRGYS